MLKTDVVVIGAGPAGLIAAREVAERGVDVLVLEEHKEIGMPCHCAGLLSLNGLMEIGVPLNADFVQNKLTGALFHSPSGLSFTVEREEAVACVVDRSKFDKFLAKQATSAGVDIKLQSKVQKIKRRNKQLIVSGPWGQINTRVVVDAEGIDSRFVKELELQPLKPEYILPAIQFELTDIDVNSAYAEIYVSKKIAPRFFAWVIPINSNSARVGLACSMGNPLKNLQSFIQNRFIKPSRILIQAGRIVTCGPIPRTFVDNFVVVGDAAGQVKPTTGGGVILGGICALISGKIVAEAVIQRTTTRNFLREYETLWKRKLGREFTLMLLARNIANRLSDETTDKIFKIIIEKNLQTEFSMKGDMDFQAKLMSAFAKKSGLFKILLTAAPDIMASFLGILS
jgi:geranylgeranyl reductase family protein